MQIRRTDLALEARELWQESAGETTKLPGVEAHEGIRDGIPVTTVRVLEEEGEKALGKPRCSCPIRESRPARGWETTAWASIGRPWEFR